MPVWRDHSFTWGSLAAMLLLAVLVLLLRWAFSGGTSLVRYEGGRDPGDPQDYGLLVAVAAPRTYEAAAAITDALDRERISTTLARTTQGLRVMVFPEDAERARTVVAGFTP